MPTDQTWAEEIAAGLLPCLFLKSCAQVVRCDSCAARPAVAAALVEAARRGEDRAYSPGMALAHEKLDHALRDLKTVSAQRDAALVEAEEAICGEVFGLAADALAWARQHHVDGTFPPQSKGEAFRAIHALIAERAAALEKAREAKEARREAKEARREAKEARREVERLAGAVRYYEETVCLPGSPSRLALPSGGEAKPIETVRLKDLLSEVERLRRVFDAVRSFFSNPIDPAENLVAVGLRFKLGRTEQEGPRVAELRDALRAAIREETPQ